MIFEENKKQYVSYDIYILLSNEWIMNINKVATFLYFIVIFIKALFILN